MIQRQLTAREPADVKLLIPVTLAFEHGDVGAKLARVGADGSEELRIFALMPTRTRGHGPPPRGGAAPAPAVVQVLSSRMSIDDVHVSLPNARTTGKAS